jgi:hypothetical protein
VFAASRELSVLGDTMWFFYLALLWAVESAHFANFLPLLKERGKVCSEVCEELRTKSNNVNSKLQKPKKRRKYCRLPSVLQRQRFTTQRAGFLPIFKTLNARFLEKTLAHLVLQFEYHHGTHNECCYKATNR